MLANFGPKFGGMIHVIKMGKFVKNHIVAQRLRHLHKANIERNSASRRTTAPPSGGMTEATTLVFITIAFGIILKAIGQIFLGLFHEDFLFGVASALSLGALQGNFFADKVAIGIQNPFSEKVASVARNGHLQAPRRRHGKTDALCERTVANYYFAEFVIINHN